MHALRFLAKPAGIILGTILGIVLLLGFAITWSTQHSDLQQQFLLGSMPETLPDGPYRGTVPGYAGAWEGKVFDGANGRGKNLFRSGTALEPKYPFLLERSKGLRDPQLQVLRLNYNVEGNPGWLRLVTDEMVQTGSGKYLGKVYATLVPGYPFALGFFELSKN
jgi:hypothetical protein